MTNIFRGIFKICLVSFILIGCVLVLGQITGLLLQKGSLVVLSKETLAQTAFVLSAIAAVIGFALSYVKPNS